MDYNDANQIISETNLEEELIKKGVTDKHIQYIKNTKNKYVDNYQKYYDYVEDRKNILVDPIKIKIIPRMSTKYSLYDAASGEFDCGLNVYRMAYAVLHIKNDSLSTLYNWYECKCDPVGLIYYMDDDVYMVSPDGSHRSLYCIIVGAPKIRANVSIYRKNRKKYLKYVCEIRKEEIIKYLKNFVIKFLQR